MAVTIRAISKDNSSESPPRIGNKTPAIGPWKMPAELGLSIPRSVRFTAVGRVLVGIVLALVGGAIFSVLALLAMNSRTLALEQQLDQEGVQVEAQVVELGPLG